MLFTNLFISGSEIFIILLVVLLLFGANKLPEIARGLGKGMNEFKKATDDIKSEFNEHTRDIQNDVKSIKNDLEESTRFDDVADNYFRDDNDNTNQDESLPESGSEEKTGESDYEDEDVYEEPYDTYSNRGEYPEYPESPEESETEERTYQKRSEDSEDSDYPTDEDNTEDDSARKDSSSS